MSRTIERSSSIRINVGSRLNALAFSSNGQYLVSGSSDGVRIWWAEDGKELASMPAPYVRCISVSKDMRWIAAGTYFGELFMWDARTYQKVLSLEGASEIYGVDFSPDSTRLVTASANNTASIWDIGAGRACATLEHDGVLTVKYSPQGDRIATASPDSVRVYNSNDGHSHVDLPIKVSGLSHTGLFWSNTHLFLVSDNKIKQIDASTGSVFSEWPVPEDNEFGRIALPTHGDFIAHSASRMVTLWDTVTHAQLGLIPHSRDVHSIALSPDDRLLAIGEESGKITLKPLSYVTEPDLQIDVIALESWKQDQLEQAETLLTPNSRNPSHHALASRALVRARLQQWDPAIADANQSIKIKPSVLGFIARSVALVGVGKKHEAYRACDMAFKLSHSTCISFILLIKAIVVFMAGEHEDAISRLDDLIDTLHFNSVCHVVQAYMYLARGDSRLANNDSEGAIESFERAQDQVTRYSSQPPLLVSLISGWKFEGLGITIRQRLCEALYSAGRANEGGESLLKMLDTFETDVYTSDSITEWVSDFTRRCLSIPEGQRIASPDGTRRREIPILSSLRSQTTTSLLTEWVKSTLASRSWKDTLASAARFVVSRFNIYRVICEHLDMINRITDASECFLEMMGELGGRINGRDEQAQWVLEFQRHCATKLESLADTAMSAERHGNAISQYSSALSLGLASPQGLLIKRSKAYLARGQWANALEDANQVIMLDPSSPWGYEARHTALREAGDHENAINAFEMMLLKMSLSPDQEIRERHCRYADPEVTKANIRRAIQDAIRALPRVLINTASGRICNKTEQAAAFESLPIFSELVSSMTARIDHARIEQKVTEYYRYATFSHKWEENEPLFEQILHIVVYDLDASPTHDKLQRFCKIVREAGFAWAWSDTCCINKMDHFVLQEAIVAMFKWYQGSALTVIFLRGVHSPSHRGELVKSIWNTRAWTFQEYHASKVVQFYTEDWMPYLDLDISNHKDSPEIISEMEEATGISARALMALRPGLDDIREKLCLASRRQTSLVEDAAYSLLGIFSIALPVVYGEGDQALGRLLAQLLTSAADTSILAWTGKSGSFNSCLPARITAFDQLSTTHIPQAIKGAEMEVVTAGLQASLLDFTSVIRLYDRLNELPVASFTGQRLKLPCIKFKLGPLSSSRTKSGYVFYGQTTMIRTVEIKTEEDLSQLDSLYLVHPWIDFLLDRQPIGSLTDSVSDNTDDRSSLVDFPSSENLSETTLAVPQTRKARFVARLRPFGVRRDSAPLLSSTSASQPDKLSRALRVLARLSQPFGALLLTPNLVHVSAYRRVAADSIVTVQVEEITPAILNKMVDSVRVHDVL